MLFFKSNFNINRVIYELDYSAHICASQGFVVEEQSGSETFGKRRCLQKCCSPDTFWFSKKTSICNGHTTLICNKMNILCWNTINDNKNYFVYLHSLSIVTYSRCIFRYEINHESCKWFWGFFPFNIEAWSKMYVKHIFANYYLHCSPVHHRW